MVEANVDVPKGKVRLCSTSRFPLSLHLWLPPVVFSCNNRGYTPHAIIIGSRTGIDLEVAFLVALQSTLLEAHARSLGLLKTRAAMIRRCSHVDERPGYGYEVEIVMMRMLISMITRCQDEVCRSCVKIMWVDHVSDHVLQLCKYIIWLVGLVTMALHRASLKPRF